MDDAHRVSVTICGDGGCGKSSITLRLVRSQWTNEYDPTIEDSYSVTRTIDGTTYSLTLTDTAGQEEYRGMWSSSNLASDAFLLVYDITAPSSLATLTHYSDLVQVESETRQEQGRIPPYCMVAGNKSDRVRERQISSKEGLDWARARGCGFMETSAKELVNIEETFALIVRRVAEYRNQQAAGLPLTLLVPTARRTQPSSSFAATTPPEEAPAAASPSRDEEKSAVAAPSWRKRGLFWSRLKCW
ncbi:hypothetical protein LTR66_006265 [Elasticomyces elasticus]|nr:hypothetical protein LTR50_002256 [Elasticomyces elasticus]KAK4992476.1 hypothetical protein LTR66_006265 [Elasticomyces elasticus]KAK5008899.1 hypothetical protein LTR28_003350 [Elasticomyces elasticus]